MIIGRKEDFAIYFELDPKYNNTFMDGLFCFYINNQRVGKLTYDTMLVDVMIGLERYITKRKNRVFPNLYSLNDKRIFDLILYYQFDSNQAIYQYLPQDYDMNSLSINIAERSMDDGAFIYLIDNEQYTKVIYGNLYGDGSCKNFKNRSSRIIYRECMPSSIILPQGRCDEVIEEAYSTLNAIYQERLQKEQML